MYRLFVPELPITVCAGDGQEIIDVFEAFLLPRPVKSYARDVVEADWRPVPNKLFDQAFGIGGEETIPRPRATRAFIGDMVVQRGQVFAQMIFAIMRALVTLLSASYKAHSLFFFIDRTGNHNKRPTSPPLGSVR